MPITTKAELEAAIVKMEQKQVVQKQELITQFRKTKDSLDPVNMAKGALNKWVSSSGIIEGVLPTITGIAAGFLSKKIVTGRSPGPIKKLVGELLQLAIAKTSISNADKIRAYGIALYHAITGHSKKKVEEELVSADDPT